jgi:hypothetical protein
VAIGDLITSALKIRFMKAIAGLHPYRVRFYKGFFRKLVGMGCLTVFFEFSSVMGAADDCKWCIDSEIMD